MNLQQHEETPFTKKRNLEHKIQIEDQEMENMYSSCCSRTGKTDVRLIRFTTKICFSFIVLSFSFYSISTADECDSLIPFWTSLISIIVGAWINGSNTDHKTILLLNKDT